MGSREPIVLRLRRGQAGAAEEERALMAIERMLSEEVPARVLVARVLAEAGIEYVFGISGGHTGRRFVPTTELRPVARERTRRE